MKINRFIALAAIALLIVGVMSAISMKVSAHTATQAETCDQQDDDAAEVQNAPDTDNKEKKCSDQNTSDEQDAAIEAENIGGVDATPAGTPAISAEAAQKTAETYLNAGKATKVELDDQDGKLVYQVEIGGTDVNVDAMTGSVLNTETAEE